MVIELELDLLLEARFVMGRLPLALLDALGERKQALYETTGPSHHYGSEGRCEISAAGTRFLVFVRAGRRHKGEDGTLVHPVRVLHVIEITTAEE